MTFSQLRIGCSFRWTLDGARCWKTGADSYATEYGHFTIKNPALFCAHVF